MTWDARRERLLQHRRRTIFRPHRRAGCLPCWQRHALFGKHPESLDSPAVNINTTKRVIEFSVQKYREDPAFAQRVDNSVTRILAAKLNIYKDFTFSNVAVPSSRLAGPGTGTAITFEVARNSCNLDQPGAARPHRRAPASAAIQRAHGLHHRHTNHQAVHHMP